MLRLVCRRQMHERRRDDGTTTRSPLLRWSEERFQSAGARRRGPGSRGAAADLGSRGSALDVRKTLEPGTIVQAVADRHGVTTGQLYTWRRQMLATALAGFAPVQGVAGPAPLSLLVEGIGWRMPARSWRPEMAG